MVCRYLAYPVKSFSMKPMFCVLYVVIACRGRWSLSRWLDTAFSKPGALNDCVEQNLVPFLHVLWYEWEVSLYCVKILRSGFIVVFSYPRIRIDIMIKSMCFSDPLGPWNPAVCSRGPGNGIWWIQSVVSGRDVLSKFLYVDDVCLKLRVYAFDIILALSHPCSVVYSPGMFETVQNREGILVHSKLWILLRQIINFSNCIVL